MDAKKPIVQKQRRLNLNMQKVVKKEIVKLLDTHIIYPIADSPWVSPIYYVPKKGGITVVTNENDELIPTRTVTGWRLCIDYRKLNEATAKDHFPLPFMDKMLERLAGNKYFCFLDGKANVVADALSRKEREPPLKVRALVMAIGLDLPRQILNAQTKEASKPKNIKEEDVGGMQILNGQIEARKPKNIKKEDVGDCDHARVP
uniref:Reverse transcriptase domain-containing protein n=1 Tax=Tanacetum cinerariifolium TaxID=118510 RepID=A0A6L2J7A9_TANCI|nr:reverse transcriptase domain-containing protein [Tanacetum cinerariifolium]